MANFLFIFNSNHKIKDYNFWLIYIMVFYEYIIFINNFYVHILQEFIYNSK